VEKKAYEHPKAGVFYMIPDPKKLGTYTLYSEFQEDGGKDVTHLFLFDRVKELLNSRFKANLDETFDAYTGIPRGRIIEPSDPKGNWLVTHGGDFSLNKYRDEIISEFSLRDAVELGKVKYEIDPHEKMGPKDRKGIESALRIEFTATSWKKK
jgi:hypothetical protein